MDPLFLAYLSLTAALVITPGATVAVVVRNTLSGGYRGGLSAALGAALGNSIHAVAAGLGLAVLVSRSPLLLALIQLTGGGYLLWLGLKSARRILDHDALPSRASSCPAPVLTSITSPGGKGWSSTCLTRRLLPSISPWCRRSCRRLPHRRTTCSWPPPMLGWPLPCTMCGHSAWTDSDLCWSDRRPAWPWKASLRAPCFSSPRAC
ncbi:MAG: LysE family transporter [Acidobacteria bacterium]|nr:LysE family transporter [Acidobacteriota bacterium]